MSDWDKRYATRSERMRASEIRELLKLLDKPDIISFAGGVPDPALFPKEETERAYAAILSESASSALQYSVSEGFRPLREWLVGYMARVGVTCGIENIVITSGSQQGLDYLGKLFISPGDTVLTTWPTYLGALQAFNTYEPRYDRLPADEADNMTPHVLREAATRLGSRLACGYLTADFSNPTGETVSRAARERLLDLASTLDIPLIEDGAYQALRFDGEAVPPLLALDAARHGGDIEKTNTIFCGSFSKVLTPGLRVGWICAASPVITKVVLAKQASDLHSPTINQMVIDRVARAAFDSQVVKIRAAYRSRRDSMLAALTRHMPAGVTWTKPEGGMFIWVTLPEGMDSAPIMARAVEREKIAFVPGQAFYPDGSGCNTLRLSYSLATAEEIETGIGRLGKLLTAEIAALKAA